MITKATIPIDQRTGMKIFFRYFIISSKMFGHSREHIFEVSFSLNKLIMIGMRMTNQADEIVRDLVKYGATKNTREAFETA